MNLINNPPVSQAGCLLVDDSQEPCSENALDSDGDGVCDQAELILGTDPFNPCDLGEEERKILTVTDLVTPWKP